MKIWFTTLMVSGLSISLYAQSNHIPAVAITNSGDSVKGKIVYRNWNKTPQTFTFINAANETSTLDAYSIQGLFIPSTEESYTSCTVELDMLPGTVADVIQKPITDSPIVKRRVFLLQIISHPVLSLLQYDDSVKQHFFYQKNNDIPVELIHHYLYNENSRVAEEITTYKRQLAALTDSCPSAKKAVNFIKFDKKDIRQIVVNYLNCRAPGSVVSVKKEQPSRIRSGLMAGLIYNTFNFSGSDILAEKGYKNTLSPVIGIAIDFAVPRTSNSWHIVGEIIYKQYKTSNRLIRYDNYSLGTWDVDLSFGYIQFNALVRYMFKSNNSVKSYFNAGVGNGLIVSDSKNSIFIKYDTGGSRQTTAFNKPANYELSLLAGAGLQLKKFQLEARLGSSGRAFSPSPSLHINPISFQLLFTFRI